MAETKTEKKEYVLKGNKFVETIKHGVRKMYRKGDKVMLTPNQAEKYADLFVPAGVAEKQAAADKAKDQVIAAKDKEIGELQAKLAEATAAKEALEAGNKNPPTTGDNK